MRPFNQHIGQTLWSDVCRVMSGHLSSVVGRLSSEGRRFGRMFVV